MRGQPIAKKLGKLDGKFVRLTIDDTANSWCFQFTQAGFKVAKNNGTNADIHIKGSLKNFLLLATQNEDSDTLFFNQELSLEGNTADGLYLRNSLDAMEFDMAAHLQAVFGHSVAKTLTPVLERINFAPRLKKLARSFV